MPVENLQFSRHAWSIKKYHEGETAWRDARYVERRHVLCYKNSRGMVNGPDISPRVAIGRVLGRVGSHGSMSRALLHEGRWAIIVTRALLCLAGKGNDYARPELQTELVSSFRSACDHASAMKSNVIVLSASRSIQVPFFVSQ